MKKLKPLTNPYAIYVNCDGAMDYSSKNFGGVGYVISFPDFVCLESIEESIGSFSMANIERLEIQALIEGMNGLIELYKDSGVLLKEVNQIILITDRFRLNDKEGTNPYTIRRWRANGWKTMDGTRVKNKDLLDKLDKTRKKLSEISYCKIDIEYRRRKFNKQADKLAKKGKELAPSKVDIGLKGVKIGKRKFDGSEVKYYWFSVGQEVHIRIFKKDPSAKEWEVWGEICEEKFRGMKLKICANDLLTSRLMRHHEFRVTIKQVNKFHLRIEENFEEIIEEVKVEN